MTATDPFETHERAEASARSPTLEPKTEAALRAYFQGEEDAYDHLSLHYGSDLDGCARKTWYRLHDAARDPLSLGDMIRFHGGRVWGRAFVDALARAGARVLREVEIRPPRLSARRWVGHADAVDLSARKLWEVKAPRAGLFARAKGDPQKLVRESYRWQAAAYLHELRRLETVATGSWIFLDREGSHAPVEVPMAPLLPSLAEVEVREVERAALADRPTPPARASGTLEVRVWKGKPKQGRRIEAVDARYVLCSYCPFQGVCSPGPEELPRALTTLPNVVVTNALEAAEAAWASGDKSTPQVTRYDLDTINTGGW